MSAISGLENKISWDSSLEPLRWGIYMCSHISTVPFLLSSVPTLWLLVMNILMVAHFLVDNSQLMVAFQNIFLSIQKRFFCSIRMIRFLTAPCVVCGVFLKWTFLLCVPPQLETELRSVPFQFHLSSLGELKITKPQWEKCSRSVHFKLWSGTELKCSFH